MTTHTTENKNNKEKIETTMRKITKLTPPSCLGQQGFRGALQRLSMTLMLMMLTTMTAWATTKTVSYTISYKDNNTKYWLDGSDNTHYNIGSGLGMAKTYTMPMGDVTITVTSAGTRCSISYFRNTSILGFSDADYTFTFASNNYFISNVKIKDLAKRTELSVDNDTKECTVFWNHSQYNDAQQIEVTFSDTKPLFYYGITYELSGGTNAAGNPQTYEKSAGVASFADATRKGYTFGAWYDNSEFNGDAVTSIATGSKGAKTLWAKWTANTYNVCFNANGGTGTMSNQTFTCDQAQALTANAFTRDNHDFSGWNTAANGSGTGYTNGESVSNLATEQGSTVNLYAQWTPKNYDVTFDVNGHGTAPAAQTVAYGTKATEPATPTEAGWTFGGWYKESSCVNRWEFGADNVTGTTTLYAKWAQNVYTITYELDGGVNSASNPLVYTNTDNITLAAPTKTGYTFTGWTPDDGVISSGSTGNKTFTANWQVNQYTITFNADGGTVISGNIAPITQNYGTTVTATATLAKQGYLFNGWAALPATMPAENITVYPDWTRLYHQDEVAATCTENGTKEYYYGNQKYWTENADHLTYTEIYYSYLVIPYTGHTWGEPQWKWGINYLGDREATLKLVCTHCGFIDSTPSQDGDITSEVTTAPTETTDGVRTYTAKITGYGTEYSDTYQEAIPRLFKVAKIGDTQYSYLKDAIAKAKSNDVITLLGDVVEPNTYCNANYNSIVIDLNSHSVLIDKITTMSDLTVKNGSLVCNIDNGNVGGNSTLTLDNAKLTCVGVYDSEWGNWLSGIQWMAKNIAVTNGSTMYVYGGTYLGGGADDGFNLTIDGTSCVVLENAILSGYNDTRVRSQFAQYLPSGYTINTDYEDNIPDGKVIYGSSEYTDPVTLGPSTITLADNADNSTIISAYASYVKNVTLSGRTLTKNGHWNTLCLPFDVTLTQINEMTHPLHGATIKELNTTTSNLSTTGETAGTLTLNFTEVYNGSAFAINYTKLEAGKPYIVRWGTPESPVDGTIDNPVFSGVTISSTTPTAVMSSDGKVMFVGQYSPFEIVASNAQGDNQGNLNEILMFGSGSQLGYSKNPRTLKCFRCHFYVNADGSELEQGGSSVRNFVLNFGDDEATGVVPIDNGQWIMDNEADAWYSLDGRRLSGKPTQKGLYIHNGNKVAIK